MAGPVRRNGGMFYLRRELPKDLWDARGKLREMGLKVGSKDIWKSLRTADPKVASERYLWAAAALETTWATWREALVKGPTVLTERNITALAGERAKTFLDKYQDDPAMAPDTPERPQPELSAGLAADVLRLSGAEQQRLREAVASLEEGDPMGVLPRLDNDPVIHGILSRLMAEPLRATLEAEHGVELDRLLAEKGEAIAPSSRAGLLLEAARLQARARGSLHQMADTRDFSEPEWVKTIPEFKPSPRATKAKREKSLETLTLTTLLEHKAKSQSMKALTVSKYHSVLAAFAKFIHHNDARRVTREDVRKWRDHLQGRGLTPKTINDHYLAALKAVLKHGVKEFDLPAGAADAIRDERQPPAPTRSKDYTGEEAEAILAATFKGTTKAVSAPHQRALFWVHGYAPTPDCACRR